MSKYYIFPSSILAIDKGGFERIRIIEQTVCELYGIPAINLYQKRRKRSEYSEPFHVCFAMIMEFTYIKKECIIERYNRDRCTTYHAQKVVRNLEFCSVEFRERMAMLRASLTNKFLNHETISNYLGNNTGSILYKYS